MEFDLQEIRREIRFKAVLYGFLTAVILGFIIAVIFGGGWGLYATYYITIPYLERCGQHCDPAEVEKYIVSAIVPYKEILNIIGIGCSFVSLFVLPVLGGFITGRKAKNAEIINSAILGAILIFYSIGGSLFASNRMPADTVTASSHATMASYIFAAIVLTIPITVLGGILARKKNMGSKGSK